MAAHPIHRPMSDVDNSVPTISTAAAYDDYFSECLSEFEPVLLVNTVDRDETAIVEIDFLPTKGAYMAEDELGLEFEVCAVLDREAVGAVNDVVATFDCAEIDHGDQYWKSDEMARERAERLAGQLEPIVTDPENWEGHNPFSTVVNVEPAVPEI